MSVQCVVIFTNSESTWAELKLNMDNVGQLNIVLAIYRFAVATLNSFERSFLVSRNVDVALDSQSDCHLTNNITALFNFQPRNIITKSISGTSSDYVKGTGMMCILLHTDSGHVVQMSIPGVLYAPHAQCTLLSTGKLNEQGHVTDIRQNGS